MDQHRNHEFIFIDCSIIAPAYYKHIAFTLKVSRL